MKQAATSEINTLQIKQDKSTVWVNRLNSKQPKANSPLLSALINFMSCLFQEVVNL